LADVRAARRDDHERLQIYGAYARFGERNGPYYAPNPFQDHGFPTWSGSVAGLLAD